MRKTMSVVAAAGSLLLGVASAGPAFARAPPPLLQECGPNSNGGTLMNGVCVLPGAIGGGANNYLGYVIASNGEAADTFTIVSGSLPPGLSMPSHYGVGDTYSLETPPSPGPLRSP